MTDPKMPPLRLAAATLREQAFDVAPLVPVEIAQPLADWLDSTALSWETAVRHDPDILQYLVNPPNYPNRVAHAVVFIFHGETVAAQGNSSGSAIDFEGNKTAPGVASTNTGSLAHSEAVDNGRTCIE